MDDALKNRYTSDRPTQVKSNLATTCYYLMRDGKMKSIELGAKTGWGQFHLLAVLNLAKKKGLVYFDESGLWRATEKGIRVGISSEDSVKASRRKFFNA